MFPSINDRFLLINDVFLLINDALQRWLPLFLEQIKQTSFLEWIAVIFGVIQVLLARANKVSLYPAGIIATLATAWVLFHSKLYAESALNAYYLIMSIYGWYFWSSHKGKPQPPITKAGKRNGGSLYSSPWRDGGSFT
jgi:nicotinamide mononucleotide transporter